MVVEPQQAGRVVGIAIAAGLGFVAGGLAVGGLPFVVLAIAAAAAAWLVAQKPVWAVWTLVALLLFEGALRKWFFPSIQQFLYFGKDGLLFLLLLRWLIVDANRNKERHLFQVGRGAAVSAALFGVMIFLQIFNPRNPSLILYAFGLRTYLLPMALVLIVPAIMRRSQFETLLRAFVWAMIPLGLLALVQLQLPSDHVLNRYAGEGTHYAAEFGRRGEALVRVTSTFSYITGYATYLMVATLAIPLVLLTRNRSLLFGGLLIGFGVLNLIFTGSRAPLVLTLLALPLVSYPLWRGLGPRYSLQFLISVVAVGTLLMTLFPEPIEQFTYRVETAGDAQERIERTLRGPFEAIEMGGLFGWGPGTTHQSRFVLLQRVGDWGPLPQPHEEEPARVVTEVGVVGAIFWYFFRIMMILTAARWFADAFRRRDQRAQLATLPPLLLGVFTLALSLILNVYLYFFWALCLGGARLYGASPGSPEAER